MSPPVYDGDSDSKSGSTEIQANQVNHNTGHFGFSAVDIDDIDAQQLTLATLVFDCSGSTSPFRDKMAEAIKRVISDFEDHDRRENLLLRVTAFETDIHEIHGFMNFDQVDPDDYEACLKNFNGGTALYDATMDAVEASNNYGKALLENKYDVNAHVIVVTDGAEYHSRKIKKPELIKTEIERAIVGECLESLRVDLVRVNDTGSSPQLDSFFTDAGFTDQIKMDDVKDKTFAKFAQWISKSLSSTSQQVGTGKKSQSITF